MTVNPASWELPDNPLNLPRVVYPEYHVAWSESQEMFIATCDWFPGHWGGDRDVVKALDLFADYLIHVFGEDGLVARRDSINRARGYV